MAEINSQKYAPQNWIRKENVQGQRREDDSRGPGNRPSPRGCIQSTAPLSKEGREAGHPETMIDRNKLAERIQKLERDFETATDARRAMEIQVEIDEISEQLQSLYPDDSPIPPCN